MQQGLWAGVRLFQPLAVVTCLLLLAARVEAQPRVTEGGFVRIASWDLAEAHGAGVFTQQKQIRKSWRNTFGSERRVAPKPVFSGSRLKADVVLLQGVKSVREARQAFPARDWKVLFSRQILKLGGRRPNTNTAATGQGTATAIAVRYQRRLRVSRLEHLKGLGQSNETATSAEASGGGATKTDEPREVVPDGLALRLVYSGMVLWVVSAALPSRCRLEPETCDSAKKLARWANTKRSTGSGVVIGGQLDASLRQAGPNGVCASQEIVADRALQAEAGADTVGGCVAFVDVKVP